MPQIALTQQIKSDETISLDGLVRAGRPDQDRGKQQITSDETISLDGINLNMGMQKSEVMDLLGKKFLLQHYGGKEDVWRVFEKGGKYRAVTSGSMIAQIKFNN